MRWNAANAMLVTCVIALALAFPVLVRPQTGADYERGIVEFQAGNYAQASELFARAEALTPGATDALLYEGKCLIHLQDFAGAEKALRGYLLLHADSADALYLLGFVLHRENRPAESLDIYTKAATRVRPTSDDLKIVGLDYVLLHDYADAIRWLEKAVEFDPKNKDAWYYLGRAYYTTSRVLDAKKAFLTVLQLEPQERQGGGQSRFGLRIRRTACCCDGGLSKSDRLAGGKPSPK